MTNGASVVHHLKPEKGSEENHIKNKSEKT